jgi:hypothetical protein
MGNPHHSDLRLEPKKVSAVEEMKEEFSVTMTCMETGQQECFTKREQRVHVDKKKRTGKIAEKHAQKGLQKYK